MRSILMALAALAPLAAHAFIAPYPFYQETMFSGGTLDAVRFDNGVAGAPDIGPRMALDSAREMYVIGTAAGSGTSCAVVRRVASYMTITRWERRICGANPTFGGGITVDGSGNVAITGTVAGSRYEAKLSAEGTTLWERTTPGTGAGNLGVGIFGDGASGFVVVGVNDNAIEVTRLQGSDGAPLATTVIPKGVASELRGATADLAGNTYVGFWRTADAQGTRAALVARVQAAGGLAWEVPAGGTPPPMLAIDSDGQLVHADGASVQRRSAATGAQQWSRPMLATGITTDDGANTLAVGYSTDPQLGVHEDLLLLKWDRNGNELVRHVEADVFGREFVRGVLTVDVSGNAIVAAALRSPGEPQMTWMLRLSGLDGHKAHASAFSSNSHDQLPREVRSTEHGQYIVSQMVPRTTTAAASVIPLRSTTQYSDRDAFTNPAPAEVALWRHDDGRIGAWDVEAGGALESATLIPGGTGWVPTHFGRFDADALSDLIWAHPDGRVAVWLMNDMQQKGGALLIPAGTGWHVKLLRGFSNENHEDILWEHDDGRSAVWIMDGTRQVGGALLLPAGTGWQAQFAGEFNGDLKYDIVWWHPAKGAAIWYMDGARQVGGGYLGTTLKPVAVEFIDQDFKSDIVFTDGAGSLELWLMDGTTRKSMAALRPTGSPPFDKVLVRDVNGDDAPDYVVFRQDGGVEALLTADGIAVIARETLLAPGSGWTVKRIANFDSQPQADLLLEHADGRVALGRFRGLGLGLELTPFGPGPGWHAVPMARAGPR